MIAGITGGAGYIGSTLIKNLIKNDHEVTSVDSLILGNYDFLAKDDLGKKAVRVIGDIRDRSLLKKVWKDVDFVAHLAALPGLELCNEKPEEAISINVFGTYQVLETARLLDINRVVFCSSAAVYGNPIKMPVTENHQLRPLNLYGVTKLAGEKILDTYWDNYGIETINLRFGNIYGVGLYTRWETVIPKFIKQALSGKQLTIYGDGKYSRDFVHVNDITKALTLSLTTKGIGGETFNVGGTTMSINQIAQIIKEEILEITGKEVTCTNTPPRKGETKEFSYNLEKIRNQLGFKNRWKVRKGVQQLIKYAL
jgi:nucleoside-diphosphate-sugar epimerase